MAVLRSEGSLLHASHRPSSQPGTPAARGSDLPQLHQHACSINGHAANRPAGLDEQLRALAARRLNALADDGSGFLALACFFGLLLGLAMPVDGAMPAPWDRVGEVSQSCLRSPHQWHLHALLLARVSNCLGLKRVSLLHLSTSREGVHDELGS